MHTNTNTTTTGAARRPTATGGRRRDGGVSAPDPGHRLRLDDAVTIAVFGYSVARAVPLWGPLADSAVNPWVFLFIDVATAWPYARSWPMLVRAIRAGDGGAVGRWAAVLTTTFAAPYAYVGLAGEDVPATVWWALAAFALIAVVSAGQRVGAALRAGA